MGVIFVTGSDAKEVLPAASTPPPRGRLLDIGGRKLHLYRTGSGGPTVVVENGSGAFSIDWALVQPKVSEFAEICTYDRAGYAWSDPAAAVDMIPQITDDLHLLLAKAAIRPPYILVGASLGGVFIRAYQRRYPDQVAGMVFVDPTGEDGLGFTVDGQSKALVDMTAAELSKVIEQLVRENRPLPPLPTAIEAPFDRLPKELRAARLWGARRFLEDRDLRRVLVPTEATREEFVAQREQRLSAEHPLGDLPLIVLSRGLRTDEHRRRQHSDIAALSSVGQLVIAPESDHEIHLYRPDLVIRAIRDVSAAAKQRAQNQGS